MTDARPVIIITRTRSGSTLLSESLEQFPSVASFGEIFKSVKPAVIPPRAKKAGIPRDTIETLCSLQRTDRAQCWQLLCETLALLNKRPSAKMFYIGADPSDELWDCFASATILHLVRENILAMAVSSSLALRSGKWRQDEYSPQYDQAPVTVSPAECEELFLKLRARISWLRQRYAGKDYHEISYDSICDVERTRVMLSNILRETIPRLNQISARQRRRPLSEIVDNYAEVAHFDVDLPLIAR